MEDPTKWETANKEVKKKLTAKMQAGGFLPPVPREAQPKPEARRGRKRPAAAMD